MTAGARDLERDVEASRARLDGALDRLQVWLNPSAIVEEFAVPHAGARPGPRSTMAPCMRSGTTRSPSF
ncbi:DUF3618 domain-containing protein [Methylobacterium sp. J-077]|uniref:DUF3618 domain-containing protein n=1 Tax=Methylobacterium sp. J-077 TaxID=2836656 RepID=UPI00391CEBD4